MKPATTQRSPKILEHRELVGDCKIRQKPGNGYVTFGYLYLSYLFRPLRVEPVKGIDYSAFKIRGMWIGQYLQWADEWKELRTAEEVFKFDVPMTTMQMGLDCTIQFINVSKKAQPFAVKLVGKFLR